MNDIRLTFQHDYLPLSWFTDEYNRHVPIAEDLGIESTVHLPIRHHTSAFASKEIGALALQRLLDAIQSARSKIRLKGWNTLRPGRHLINEVM